jgi:hypothetical protein
MQKVDSQSDAARTFDVLRVNVLDVRRGVGVAPRPVCRKTGQLAGLTQAEANLADTP